MSLTLPAAFLANARVNAAREEWIVRLYYDNEGANDYIGIAFRDLIIDSVQYHPVVTDITDITHTIDLKKQSSSIQNIDIIVADKYKSGLLSDELFYGTRSYINRQITIYSLLVINATPTASSSGFCIYTGKLKKLKDFSDGLFTLEIEQEPLGKGIMIPNTLSDKNIYYPIAYGNFEKPDPSLVYDYRKVYPCPQNNGSAYFNNTIQTLASVFLGNDETNSVEADEAVFYNEGNDGFGNIEDSVGDNKDYLVYSRFTSNSLIRPVGEYVDSSYNGDFTNPDNAIDFWDDSAFITSYAVFEDTFSGAGTNGFGLEMNLPASNRKLIACVLYYKVSITISGLTWVGAEDPGELTYFRLVEQTNDSNDIMAEWKPSDGEGTWTSWAASTVFANKQSGVDSVYTESDHITAANIDNKLPEYTSIIGASYRIGASTEYTVNVKIYDVYVAAEFQEDYSDEDTKARALDKLLNLSYVYSGEDGMTKTYNGGSGVATLPNEIHRDLLKKYTEFDIADGSLDGWTDLNTNRSGWTCNWWQLTPRDLVDILNQVQYEGCFIFYQRAGGGGRYICLEDDYSSSDFTFTEDDILNITFSLSQLDDLETSFVLNYYKHPNPDMNRYLKTRSVSNSTERSQWNIGTNENILTINFDFLTADVLYEAALTGANECFYAYRNKLFGSVKIMPHFELTNRAYWGIECGDIFQLDISYYNIFNANWSDLWFMVTSVKRGVDRIEVDGFLVQNDG